MSSHGHDMATHCTQCCQKDALLMYESQRTSLFARDTLYTSVSSDTKTKGEPCGSSSLCHLFSNWRHNIACIDNMIHGGWITTPSTTHNFTTSLVKPRCAKRCNPLLLNTTTYTLWLLVLWIHLKSYFLLCIVFWLATRVWWYFIIISVAAPHPSHKVARD